MLLHQHVQSAVRRKGPWCICANCMYFAWLECMQLLLLPALPCLCGWTATSAPRYTVTTATASAVCYYSLAAASAAAAGGTGGVGWHVCCCCCCSATRLLLLLLLVLADQQIKKHVRCFKRRWIPRKKASRPPTKISRISFSIAVVAASAVKQDYCFCCCHCYCFASVQSGC